MMLRGDKDRGVLCVPGTLSTYVTPATDRDTLSLTNAPVILDHLPPSPVRDIPSYTSVDGPALLYVT